jgi:hypothetical protein
MLAGVVVVLVQQFRLEMVEQVVAQMGQQTLQPPQHLIT